MTGEEQAALDVLASVTVYRNGQAFFKCRDRVSSMPKVLRYLADALENDPGDGPWLSYEAL